MFDAPRPARSPSPAESAESGAADFGEADSGAVSERPESLPQPDVYWRRDEGHLPLESNEFESNEFERNALPSRKHPSSEAEQRHSVANAEPYRHDQQNWLALHATDLIERIQTWALDLDSRELQINIRAAQQDQRERKFRLQQQYAIASLQEQQSEINRLRERMQSQARRLAFESIG